MEPLKVIEFYAGIGGWHYAIQQSGLNLLVKAAVDINTTANNIYRYNFPTTVHLQRNICGFTANDLDALSGDMFTLSPPCQPFTRQGKQEDNLDHRTDSFYHLMDILSHIQNPPEYIMMENVQGFECSKTREHFIKILDNMNYKIQEFLISPKQFGIPNSRLRYYLLAKRTPLSFSWIPATIPCTSVEELVRFMPDVFKCYHGDSHVTSKLDLSSDTSLVSVDSKTEVIPQDSPQIPHSQAQSLNPNPSCHINPLHNYLEPLSVLDIQQYLVPDKVLNKYVMGLDIVQPDSHSSCCFTKGYYRYAVGTGSVLQQNKQERLDTAFKNYLEMKKVDSESSECLKDLQLRYFSPREVANLMYFPAGFKFPPDTTLNQCYKTLGNSVNVLVVTTLIKYLLS